MKLYVLFLTIMFTLLILISPIIKQYGADIMLLTYFQEVFCFNLSQAAGYVVSFSLSRKSLG